MCAFVNIDPDAIGNWAEKRNMPYSGYTDLASRDEVYDLVRECVERVNADLAGEPEIANSQIHRFLILHKELDADDGELTRTRKVRRGYIGEKYCDAGRARSTRARTSVHVEAQVRYEDGRTGSILGRPQDPRGEDLSRRAAAQKGGMTRKVGEVVLAVEDVSLAFGGVKALHDVSFDVRSHEVRAIIGPNGAGKSSMLNVINGVYHPHKGTINCAPTAAGASSTT